MSIHFISGKPGAGKSFYGVKLAFEELRFGNRVIVTNLPLLVGRLNEYYHEHFADDSGYRRYRIPWYLPYWLGSLLFMYLPEWLSLRIFPLSPEAAEERVSTPQQDDICSRVHLITDDEMAVFFTKRPGSTIEHVDKEEWRKGKRPDYSVVKDNGVLFILDEVHIPFNSRAWAETGAEVLYYLSQHRKLGDDVICITQAVANVDKQFRSVAQDFTYIRNLAKETFGHFRLPSRFIRKTYSQPPSGDKTEPMEMGTFTLDVKGLASCYDTAKGVGIHGRAGADTKHRKKGIHWLWFVVLFPVICWALLHYVPLLAGHALGKNFNPSPKSSPALPQDKVMSGTNLPLGAVHTGEPLAVTKAGVLPAASDATTNLPPTCVGWCIDGQGGWLVFISDGQTYSTRDNEVEYIHKRFVSCLGVVYRVKVRQPDALPAGVVNAGGLVSASVPFEPATTSSRPIVLGVSH